MEQKDTQLNIALSRLIDGEELSLLQREYPALASELAAHASLTETLASVASLRPDPERLRRALSSMRLNDAKKSTMQRFSYIRISSFFMTYRTALVLPALVLLLVATGIVAVPLSRESEPTITFTGEELSQDASRTNDAADTRTAVAPEEGSPASETPRLMKMQATEPAPASQTPQNQELASIFGPEMQGDAQDAAAAQSEVAQAADDSENLAAYQNAYDENDI